MKHALLLASVAGLAILAAAGLARRPQPVVAAATIAGAGPLLAPSVKVEHQLVRVERLVTGVQYPPKTSRVRTAAARPAPTRKQGFLSRARRVLVGNGAHRPEPFPRVQ